MSTRNVKNYYIAALHALRSASEQGAAKAPLLIDKAKNPDVQQIARDYGGLAARHERQIATFMSEIGVEPNGFKDRVMEGVGNGTDEMLKAASDDVIDLGVISGAETGAQYYRNAFVGQPAMAEALGFGNQAPRWGAMADEWQAIEDRLGKASKTAMQMAMQDEHEAA